MRSLGFRVKQSRNNRRQSFNNEPIQLGVEVLEARMMLNGDASDGVSNNYQDYLPDGFGSGDLLFQEFLSGGQEFARIPDAVSNAVSVDTYSWNTDFNLNFEYEERPGVSDNGVSYRFEQIEVEHDTNGNPIEFVIALNKYTYSISVGSGAGSPDGLGGGFGSGATTTGPYTESLNVTRDSWLVKTSDDSGVSQFMSNGSTAAYTSEILATSTAAWDYQFEKDESAIQPTIDISLDYDSTVHFQWSESIAFDDLYDQGFIGVTDSTTDGEVIVESGTLEINGTIVTGYHGEISAIETANGFTYEVSGDYSSSTASSGLPGASGSLIVAVNAEGVFKEGDVVLNAAQDAIVGHDVGGSLFIYDVDSSISQAFDQQYQFSGNGSVVTTANAEDQTAEITFDLIQDSTAYSKSVDVFYSGETVQHNLVDLSHEDGGQQVSMSDDTNVADEELIDARKNSYSFELDHSSAWTTEKSELEPENLAPVPNYYRHTLTDRDSTTTEENSVLTTVVDNYDSYTRTTLVKQLFEEKESDDTEFEVEEFFSTGSTVLETETEGLNTGQTVTTQLTRTFDLAGTQTLPGSIAGTRKTASEFEFLTNNARTENTGSTSRFGGDMLWLNGSGVSEQTRALYENTSKTVGTSTNTEENTNVHRFGDSTTVETFDENDSSFTVLINSDTTVENTIEQGQNFTDTTSSLSEDSQYKSNGTVFQHVLRKYSDSEREDWHGQSTVVTTYNDYLMQFEETVDEDSGNTQGVGNIGDDPSYVTTYEGEIVSGTVVSDTLGNIHLTRNQNRQSASLAISNGYAQDNADQSDTPVPIISDFSDYAWVNRIIESNDTATIDNSADLTTTRNYITGQDGYTLDVVGTQDQSQSVSGTRKQLENVVVLTGEFNETGIFDGSTDNWNRFDWEANRQVTPVDLSEFRSGDFKDERDSVLNGGYSHFVNYDATTSSVSQSSSYNPNWQFDIVPLDTEETSGGTNSTEINPTKVDILLSGEATRTFNSSANVVFDDRYSKSVEIKKTNEFDDQVQESIGTVAMAERSKVDTSGSSSEQVGRTIHERASANGLKVIAETTGSLNVNDANSQTQGGYVSISSLNNHSSNNLNTVNIQTRGAVTYEYDPALYLDGEADTDPLTFSTFHGFVRVNETTVEPGSSGYSESLSHSTRSRIDETLVSETSTASILVGILENSSAATDVTNLVYPEDSGEGGSEGSTGSDGGNEESNDRGTVLLFDNGLAEIKPSELTNSDDGENANLSSGKITVTKDRDHTFSKKEERVIHARMKMNQPSRELNYDARYLVRGQSTDTRLHDTVVTDYSSSGARIVSTQNETEQIDRWDIKTEGDYQFKKGSENQSSSFVSRNRGAVQRVVNSSGVLASDKPDAQLKFTTTGYAQVLEQIEGLRDRKGNYLVKDGNVVNPVNTSTSRETVKEKVEATGQMAFENLGIFPFFTDSTALAVPYWAIDGDGEQEDDGSGNLSGFTLVRETGKDGGWQGALLSLSAGWGVGLIDLSTYDNVSTKNIKLPYNFNQQAMKTFGYMADEVITYVGYMSLANGAEFAAAQALYGNLKIFFGAFEVTGGVVLVASGNFIVGGILIAHGFDTALAGVIQVLNGDTTRTFTSKSIALAYEQSQRFSGLNLDPTRAHFVGEMGDLAIGMVDFGVSAFAVGTKVAAKVSRLIGKAKGINRLDDARQVLNGADEIIDAARAGESVPKGKIEFATYRQLRQELKDFGITDSASRKALLRGNDVAFQQIDEFGDISGIVKLKDGKLSSIVAGAYGRDAQELLCGK